MWVCRCKGHIRGSCDGNVLDVECINLRILVGYGAQVLQIVIIEGNGYMKSLYYFLQLHVNPQLARDKVFNL